MNIEQAITITKGYVMESHMDSETKQTVIEALNQVAISKTETTSCEWCNNADEMEVGVKTVFYSGNWVSIKRFLTTKAQYCPNCGRRLACTE